MSSVTVAGPRPARALVVVAVASLIVNGALLTVRGIRGGGDTGSYVAAAEHLLRGEKIEGRRAATCFAFTAVLALCLASGAGFSGLMALHLAAGAAAALALYALARALFGIRAAGLAAALFVLTPDVVRWMPFVLTEWLYTCFVTITAYAVWRAAEGVGIWRWIAPIVLLFTALLRPNGWLLLPAAAVYWLWHYARRRAWSRVRFVGTAATLVVLFVTSVGYVATSTRQVDEVAPDHWLRTGTVIWGYAGWRVPMPPDPSPERGVGAGLRYALSHPLASARLAIVRVAVELAAARPYYSRSHNVVVLLAYIPLYLFAVYGAWRARAALAALLGAVIVAHLAIVGLTFADWDGRFVAYVMPLIALFAAGGATDAWSRLRVWRSSR